VKVTVSWLRFPATSETATSRWCGPAHRAGCSWGSTRIVIRWNTRLFPSTILVEVNDGYSLGHGGLVADLYARLLLARWDELVLRGR
jgi:hypothetical protein